jgi:CheY-like chemotaxis protein
VPLIAVIDDDDPFLDLMAEALGGEGYRAVVGRVEEEAMALIRANDPDLVIIDVVMSHPDSGMRVLRALRDDPGYAHLPAIVCSAANAYLACHEGEIRALGALPLAKPFDIDDLLASVRSLIGPPSRPTLDDTAG